MATDLSRFRRQVVGVRDEAPIAARVGVQMIAHAGMAEMKIIAPRDTNRYQRAWAQANNALPDVPKMPVLPIRKSRYFDVYVKRLDRQVHRLQRYVIKAQAREKYWGDLLRKRYDSIGRKGYWRNETYRKYRLAEKSVVKLSELYARAVEERDVLAMAPDGALLIGGRKTGDRSKAPSRKGTFNASRLSTVRALAYGGDAVVLQRGGRASVMAHNKEPHASIVESRQHVVARAKAAAAGRAYVETGAAMNRRMRRAS